MFYDAFCNNFVVYNRKTNTISEESQFFAELEGGGVGKVTIVNGGNNLSSSDNELIAVDNTNGVGIISATYSDPSVTLRLQTPLTGFNTDVPMPFDVGDKVFVENVGVSTGNGYNSSDFGYKTFTLTGIDTAFGNLNGATITYVVDKDPGLHDFGKFGTVTKDKDIAKFLSIDYWTTIVVYKDNKEMSRSIGETNKDKIYSQINSL